MGIFDSLFRGKQSQDFLRGAVLQLQCSGLLPTNYYSAAKKIEATGLQGVMNMTKEGKIVIEVEGGHSVIEKLVKEIDRMLFACACQTELTWVPFANKYHTFVAHPFVAAEPPAGDKRKL
jgi:hypothetical protein